MLVLPCFKIFSINCKYTSVLPEPVIPNSKNSENKWSSIASQIVLYAFCCSSVNIRSLSFLIFLFTNGFLSTCFSIISIYPFFFNVFNTDLVTSANISKSVTITPSFSSKNCNARICFSDLIFLFSIASSISSTSFFKYTNEAFFSFTRFSIIFVVVPGGSINFMQSETLQKYLLAIHFARFMFFSFIYSVSSALTISFSLYSELSFIFTTKPSSGSFLLLKGTKTLLPIFTLEARVSGIL